MDWAKYTDEGWYGDAAIRHFQRGSWYLPGDFNPGAALPVWPALEGLLFHLTGVSVIAARALAVGIFGVILILAYLLLRQEPRIARRPSPGSEPLSLAPIAAALLLAASPFCYAFMRMAVLEPLLICLSLLALLCASDLEPLAVSRWRRSWPVLAVGALLPLMVLTKTTALFLLPAIAYMLWARCGYRLMPFLRFGGLAATFGLFLWSVYFLNLIRLHLLPDYRYLFSANGYTGITLATATAVLHTTWHDASWFGPVLFRISVLLALLAVAWRPLRRSPLLLSLLFWAVGYLAFLAYHDNLQPRYYLVVAVPLTLLVPLALELAWRASRSSLLRLAVAFCTGLLLLVTLHDGRATIGYVRSPQYTFLSAAREIRRIIRADRGHSDLLLSISGSDISLMTGIPSICDDFGTMELEDRVATYKPGWYASWNQVDNDKMDALAPIFHVERVAAIPAMDDPERNLLILYRLDLQAERRRRMRKRGAAARSLLTPLGQRSASPPAKP